MNIIEQILEEWAYRVDNGMPNPKNGNHLSELAIILDEMDLGIIKNELIENLIKEAGEDDKYVYKGYGKYKEKGKEDDPDAPSFEKDKATGKYIQLTKPDEPKPEKEKKPETDTIFTSQDYQAGRLDKEREIQKQLAGDSKPKKKKVKKNKELNQEADTTNEFNEGNLSKDGVSDEEFNSNPKVKPTAKGITTEEIEKFFTDENGNIKFPKKYLKVLSRLLSTKPGGLTISDFTNASGAGTLSSTAGEILSLMGSSIKDDEKAKEFFGLIREVVKANKKDSVIDLGWVASAEKVRRTQFARYDRKYGKGNWELENMAWDISDEVESLGLSDYKKNKGYSTDVYAKIKVNGKSVLDEISLKKEIKANLLNSTSNRVADIMVRGAASEEDLEKYDDLNTKIDALLTLKDSASKRERAELIKERNAIIEKYNVNVPDDVKVANVQKNQRIIHEEFQQKSIGEISEFVKKFCNKSDTEFRDKIATQIQKGMSQKDDYKEKVTQQFDDLCSGMPAGGFKDVEEYNNLIKTLKVGDSSDIQKLSLALMNGISITNPQAQATEYLNKVIENSHNHSKAVRNFLIKDPNARKGLFASIREALPLKALFEGEENMILGDVSLDDDVLRDVFQVESFEELEQKLTIRDEPPPPSIVYRVVGKEDIPVAEISSRPDGIGYGGTWKLEMKVHPDFGKKLKESNSKLNV